jgi:hypothetical protein
VSSPSGAPDAQADTAGLAGQVTTELAALLDEHIAELRARGADESFLTSLVADLRRLAG